MDSIDKKINIEKILFTIAIVFIISRKYMISFVDSNLDIGKITSILFYGSIGILGILFLLDRKKSITEILLILICGILYVLNREGAILLIVALAVGSKKIDNDYIAKNYLIISVFLLIGCIIIFNVFPDLEVNQQVHYRYMKNSDILVPRMDYGLGNPNALFYHMMTIYAAYIFIRFKEYNNWDRLILFGSAWFIYDTTYSRTGFFAILVGLILLEILRFIDLSKISKLKILLKSSHIILSLISLLTGVFFSKNILANKILSSRPKYWYEYLVGEGSFLKPFGNSYDPLVKSLNPLDNSYIYIICILGLVTFIVFSYLIYKGIGLFIEENEKSYLVVIMMFLIYSFAENLLLEAAFSFGIVFLIKKVILSDKREIDIYKPLGHRGLK